MSVRSASSAAPSVQTIQPNVMQEILLLQKSQSTCKGLLHAFVLFQLYFEFVCKICLLRKIAFLVGMRLLLDSKKKASIKEKFHFHQPVH